MSFLLALAAAAGVLISLLLLAQVATVWLTKRYERHETPRQRAIRYALTRGQPK